MKITSDTYRTLIARGHKYKVTDEQPVAWILADLRGANSLEEAMAIGRFYSLEDANAAWINAGGSDVTFNDGETSWACPLVPQLGKQ